MISSRIGKLGTSKTKYADTLGSIKKMLLTCRNNKTYYFISFVLFYFFLLPFIKSKV